MSDEENSETGAARPDRDKHTGDPDPAQAAPEDGASATDSHPAGAAPEAGDAARVAAPRRRRRWRRLGLWSLACLLVLLVLAAAGGVWTVRRSLPDYGGTVHLAGLHAPVTVYRDDHAIPQVYASDIHDLFAAQGYLHAQERFWEMDFRRHVTGGRLAELFGADQVDTDRYLRTMGWRQVAQREWDLISPDSRRYLQDYARGVNAYLAGHSGATASLEYAVLGLTNSGYHIATWDPVDSLAWLKAMAFDLGGNMGDEVDRATLLASGLTRDQVESLYPAYPFAQNKPIVSGGTVSGGVFTMPPATPAAPAAAPGTGSGGGGAAPGTAPGDPGGPLNPSVLAAAAPALRAVSAALHGLPASLDASLPGIGSNSFVISGSHTATGEPILANDPHLSPSMPGIWYQMGLHCTCRATAATGLSADYNVEGFTFSGVPGVVIGHNARIAWGFTNLDPDVQDLYLEKVDGNRYQVDGTWRDLVLRKETINVAGGRPVPLTIRTTNNGPLLSDVSDDLTKISGGTGYGVALRWTALDPGRTMDSLFALNLAGNWDQFRAATKLFEVPSQNIVYADVAGNIGYQSPGRIPIRGKGDGRWPASGWDSGYDWTGWIPFDALPTVENPAAGYIVTANQAVVNTTTYPYRLTDDWSYGYRSQRLMDLITAATAGGAKVGVTDATTMQFDDRNDFAAQLVPVLTGQKVTGATASAVQLLRDWDFRQPADGPAGSVQARDSAAAAYFNAVWRALLSRTFDELTGDQRPGGGDRWFVVLAGLLAQPDSPWWDVKSTPAVEHRDDILVAAMNAATTELSTKLGAVPAAWRWGALHTLLLANQTFGKSGIGPIEWLFNYGPAPVSGGGSIVDATSWDAREGYATVEVPSMRMVVDLSNLDNSRWIQLTGESGHAFSAHYHDQFDLWRTGGTLPMRWDQAAITREARDTQRFTG